MRFDDKDRMQAILAFAQAIALIVGGFWIVYRYLSHERESERLTRQYSALNNEQLIRLASTQKAAEEARLRQLQLGNSQATLALAVQSEQQRLSVESQKLNVDQTRLTLDIAKAQQEARRKELDAQVTLAQLDATKRQQEVSYAGEIRFEPKHVLSAKRLRTVGDGLAEYELNYSFTFTSQTTHPFDVSFYVVDIYLGVPRDLTETFATRRLNVPNLRNPSMWPRKDDAVDWKHVNALGSILQEPNLPYGTVDRPPWSFSPPVELSTNAIGLGHLRHGEWCGREETYFVVAPRNAYVTAFLAYCLNSCRSENEGFTGSNILALRDATDSQKTPRSSADLTDE